MFLWHRNSLPWQATVQSANLPLSRIVEMSVERRLTGSTPFPPFRRQFRALKNNNMRCRWRGGSLAPPPSHRSADSSGPLNIIIWDGDGEAAHRLTLALTWWCRRWQSCPRRWRSRRGWSACRWAAGAAGGAAALCGTRTWEQEKLGQLKGDRLTWSKKQPAFIKVDARERKTH